MSEHRELQEWVEEMARLCRPDAIVWIDGSEEERQRLTKEAVRSGEMLLLNQQKLPGCLYHRTARNDVARTEDLTYICTRRREDAGPTNQWMSPGEGYRRVGEILKDSMRGRTMYVIPFAMGPVGSPFSKIGVEVTDSLYVVLNMRIMTHVGKAVLEQLGTAGKFTRCLHGKADLDIEHRLILHFPEDNAIWSCGSGYGGNVLLGKKGLALRIASYLSRNEGWLAEHMLIMGVEDPSGRIEYIAAAFPSGCGKTNLSMLVPPEGLRHKGYRIWTVGDDIAWMRVGADGRLWAVNPENGFFGIAPGTNSRTNPNMMKTIASNTIYTNVLLDERLRNLVGRRRRRAARRRHRLARPPVEAGNERRGRQAGCPARIRTAASRHRCRSVLRPCRRRSSRTACRFRRSSSADAGRRSRRWSMKRWTGNMACSSGRRWLPSGPPRRRAAKAKSAATRWPCCPSAATTWAIISSTGCRSAGNCPVRRESSTSTGFARMKTASSFGPATARTSACWNGFWGDAAARPAPCGRR